MFEFGTFSVIKKYILLGGFAVLGVVIFGLGISDCSKSSRIAVLTEHVLRLESELVVSNAANESMAALVDECNESVNEFELASEARQVASEAALVAVEAELKRIRSRYYFLQQDLSKIPANDVCAETDQLVRKYLVERNAE